MRRRSTERRNTRQAGLHPPDGVPPLKPSRTNEDISHHCLRSKVHRTIKYQKGTKVLQQPSNAPGAALGGNSAPSAVPEPPLTDGGVKTTSHGRLIRAVLFVALRPATPPSAETPWNHRRHHRRPPTSHQLRARRQNENRRYRVTESSQIRWPPELVFRRIS